MDQYVGVECVGSNSFAWLYCVWVLWMKLVREPLIAPVPVPLPRHSLACCVLKKVWLADKNACLCAQLIIQEVRDKARIAE